MVKKFGCCQCNCGFRIDQPWHCSAQNNNRLLVAKECEMKLKVFVCLDRLGTIFYHPATNCGIRKNGSIYYPLESSL